MTREQSRAMTGRAVEEMFAAFHILTDYQSRPALFRHVARTLANAERMADRALTETRVTS